MISKELEMDLFDGKCQAGPRHVRKVVISFWSVSGMGSPTNGAEEE